MVNSVLLVCCLMALASSLAIVAAAGFSFVRKRVWYNGIVAASAVAYSLVLLLCALRLSGLLPVAGGGHYVAYFNMRYAQSAYRQDIVAFFYMAGGCLALANMVVAWMLCRLGRGRITWKRLGGRLAAIAGVLVLASFVVSAVLFRHPASLFFGGCCIALDAVAYGLGLSYKEFCVMANIYLQGALLVISALFVLWMSVRRLRRNRTAKGVAAVLAASLYALAYAAGFGLLCARYHLPYDYAFDKCVNDLLNFYFPAVDYFWTNVLVFVVIWLLLFAANVWMGIVLKKKTI